MRTLKKVQLSRVFRSRLTFLFLGIVIGIIGLSVFNIGTKMVAQQAPNQSNTANPNVGAAYNEFSELHGKGYKLINPLYECNTGLPYGNTQLLDLRNSINDYINQITANNSVTRVAVWFRDLNSGPWFGINNQDQFTPSSLSKVPVMMAYYKEAEGNPGILNKEIAYINDPAGLAAQDYVTKFPLQKGKSYTVEELIQHMIINSDNVALLLLENNISNDKINQVTLDLGIATTSDLSLSVQDYATILRVLYYSTYLNNNYSEKALELMSQSEFTQGLVTLLPKNITIAHKFGERNLSDGTNQLHDCGIVYYPNHPYLICIMTKGPNFNDLMTTIQKISLEVYSEYAKMYP
jgi:beta-lactamase class A